MSETSPPITSPATLALPAMATKKEIAALLRTSIRTITTLVVRGCPVIRIGPRKDYFEPEKVLTWLRDNYGVRAQISNYRPRVKTQAAAAPAAAVGGAA
ncbi:MAG: hypothetical protein EXS36_16520 [Pedosphaera sp.]|nr:hypothetical protein [Pedosphaera sp.]